MHCVACKSAGTRLLGSLPDFTSKEFRAISSEFLGEKYLFYCSTCDLKFRCPMPGEEELLECYESLPSESLWEYEPERAVWHYIKECLNEAPSNLILDIGCFRGSLLRYLGDHWRRFGVEPSLAASRDAKQNGIEIIGKSIASLKTDGLRFGAILMVDVMEHLPRPLESLLVLSQLLESNGRLVIFTGNARAWTWRFSGLHYWYSALPEHVTFFSPEWFQWVAPRLNCSVVSIKKMSHRPSAWPSKVDEGLKNFAYVIYQKIKSNGILGNLIARIPFLKKIERWEGCWWATANDHMLITLNKNES